MAILNFALLAFSLAVQALISTLPPQTRTIAINGSGPSTVPQDLALLLGGHGLDRRENQVTSFCGDQESDCSKLGHSVWLGNHPPSRTRTNMLCQELCCLLDTTCRSSSHTPSHIFCCPHGFSCSSNTPAQCPVHNFQCPASLSGGCCPIGLRCASSLCLDYQYKTLAMYEPLVVHEFTASTRSDNDDRTLEIATVAAQNPLPIPNSNTEAAAPTCAWPNCQPEIPEERPLNLPISDRILGTPTVWTAKTGEVAVSQTDEGKDGKEGQKRLRRQACVWGAMALISVLMLVL